MTSRESTRQAILDAALVLFEQFGPSKTSVADIARRLGMSAANIYNFYPSRAAIVETVGEGQLCVLREQIAAEMARATDPWAKLRILVLTTARYWREHLQDEKDILYLHVLERRHRWEFVSNFERFLRSAAQAALRDGMAAGRLAAMAPEPAAEVLFDCLVLALDPLIIVKLDHADHERRVEAQLDLLERAFARVACVQA